MSTEPTLSIVRFSQPVNCWLQEVMDALCDLYSLLKEEDMWAGLWQKRAKYTETNIAIAYEQHGFFENAQTGYEAVSSTVAHSPF